MRYPSTIRRTNPIILEDIRENPEGEGTSWALFSETHGDILLCYDLAIRFILTPTPISISTFEKALRINHTIPKHLCERFISWISVVKTKRILYHDGITPMVSLKPDDNLTHKVPESSYCVFMPHKR